MENSPQLWIPIGVYPDSRYISLMRFAGHFIASLLLAGCFSLTVRATDVAAVGNPYVSVVARNIFGLLPIPTNNPADQAAPPVEPPPKITPNGIMTIFGNLQVLFKVATKPPPGQPPKDDSYVLTEGERQDEIEVVKIDGKAGMVTFNNHGTIQELPLVPGTATTGAAPAGAPPGGHPGFPLPRSRPPSGGAASGNLSSLFEHANAASTGAMPTMSSPSSSSPGNVGNNAKEEALSPEAQIIMMEAQRAEWLDKGNPAAAIIPPTPITQHILNGRNNGGGTPPAP